MPEIPLTALPHFEGLDLPAYASVGAAGLDLVAALQEPVSIPPGGRALIPTGLAIAVPPGFEAQVRPRSGLAIKHGITVLNSPGTIDSDYRGEIKIILANLDLAPGATAFVVSRGMRIAQLVLARVERVTWRQVGVLEATVRGSGGFGSTGGGSA